MNIVNSNSFYYNFDDFLEEKIGLTFSNLKSVRPFYKHLKLIENEENLTDIENVNLISSQLILKLILNNFQIPFDILIFDLLNSKDFYYLLIINLVKIKKLTVKIVIYNHCPSVPFHIKKKDIKEDIIKKEDIKINFHNKGYSLKELKDKLIDIDKETKILVIVNNKNESQYLYKILKKERKTHLNIHQLNEKINFREGKTTILIMENSNLIPLPHEDIEIIYDNCKRIFKEYLDLLKTYLYQGEINLNISEEEFNKLPQINIPYIPYYDVYKYYLLAVKNNLNVKKVFKDIINDEKIDEIKEILTNLNLLNEKRVMIDIDKLFMFQLGLRSSLMMYEIIKNNLQLYPFIVLVSIIDSVKFINDNIDIDDPLIFYLNKWLEFSKKFQDLNIEKSKLKLWTDEENLNFDNFFKILEKVKNLLNILTDKYDIEIGLFNIFTLLETAKPFLEKAFKSYIYHLKTKEQDNYIYTNNHQLLKIKLYNSIQYPEKIISFFNFKDEIIFYTILN